MTAHLSRERALVTGALAAVALHVLVESFVLTRPGTSASDHLASGLVPVAILFAAALALPLLRPGLRAAGAMTLGALSVALGFPSAYRLVDGGVSAVDVTGMLALAAGIILVAAGPVMLWRARHGGGSRRRRYLRRTLTAVAAALAALATMLFVVFPIAFAYGYTHLGRTGPLPELGVPSERVTVTTSDALALSATYVPSRNRAAVVVFPGRSAVAEALMLARHGYGVLLLDPRGQGRSEGDLVRWAGDRDLIAGAEYLQGRPDVDAERIGGFGSSVGGEILLVTAAESTAFSAVVSEGAGFRIGEADLTGAERILFAPLKPVLTAATALFSNHGPPPAIRDRIGRIAPRPVLLIYAEPGSGGEEIRQPKYFAAAGEPKEIWKVPGSSHTGGIDARPAEYERRVVEFFDAALLGAPSRLSITRVRSRGG
jgi:uncharacterized protein